MGNILAQVNVAITPGPRHTAGVFAESVFLGDNLIVWMLLALGGALFVGNVMALVRPPQAPRDENDLTEAPRARSIAMAALGFVVAVTALASLIV